MDAVAKTVSVTQVMGLRCMAIPDPAQRASAAQILVTIYDGEGLTSLRQHVPALYRLSID